MAGADVTQVLQEVCDGHSSAVDRLLPLVYDELRRLAECSMKLERSDHTLQATALVHEAYLKLVNQREAQWKHRAHFFAVAAQVIRRVLIDHAKMHRSQKRGGNRHKATLLEPAAMVGLPALDILALHEALERLGSIDDRQAKIVEMRFFSGMTIDEVAEVLGLAPRTVDEDWSMARAWLRRELSRGAKP